MNTTSTNFNSAAHPWIFGAFAVYAQSPHVARHVYESVCVDQAPAEPFGSVMLDTGETIDWVNIRYGVMRQNRSDGTVAAADLP